MAGIGDNEYVDASFQFPVVETTFATASAQAPIIVVPSPPAPRLGNSIGGEEEKLSEHYAEFNDLFNDAANVRVFVTIFPNELCLFKSAP